MKNTIWILSLVTIFISLLIFANFHTSKGVVIISNQSGEEVLGGNLEVCGQFFLIDPIKNGNFQTIKFKVKSDSSYNITIHLKSSTIKESLGYVTNGIDFEDTIIVNESGISLAHNKN
jgi:hypothetical protein